MSETAPDAEHWQKLTTVKELEERGGVRSVRGPYGLVAVGMSNGEPFAVSGRCRHLLAKLGGGEVADSGELVCPWHGARYDVTNGRMTRGPQGVYKPMGPPLKAACATVAPLRRYETRVRAGKIEVLLK